MSITPVVRIQSLGHECIAFGNQNESRLIDERNCIVRRWLSDDRHEDESPLRCNHDEKLVLHFQRMKYSPFVVLNSPHRYRTQQKHQQKCYRNRSTYYKPLEWRYKIAKHEMHSTTPHTHAHNFSIEQTHMYAVRPPHGSQCRQLDDFVEVSWFPSVHKSNGTTLRFCFISFELNLLWSLAEFGLEILNLNRK